MMITFKRRLLNANKFEKTSNEFFDRNVYHTKPIFGGCDIPWCDMR